MCSRLGAHPDLAVGDAGGYPRLASQHFSSALHRVFAVSPFYQVTDSFSEPAHAVSGERRGSIVALRIAPKHPVLIETVQEHEIRRAYVVASALIGEMLAVAGSLIDVLEKLEHSLADFIEPGPPASTFAVRGRLIGFECVAEQVDHLMRSRPVKRFAKTAQLKFGQVDLLARLKRRFEIEPKRTRNVNCCCACRKPPRLS
jgi:hypothetical protein